MTRSLPARLALIALCALSTSCLRHQSNIANDARINADSALFAAVVRAVADSTPGPLRIDPRVGGPAEEPDGPSGWVNAPHLVEMRRKVLSAQGITAGAADIPTDCAGVLVPDVDHTEHRGCPRQHLVLVKIGAPRSTSPYAPATLREYRAFRASHISVGPSGFNDTSYEYILIHGTSGWSLASRVPLLIAE